MLTRTVDYSFEPDILAQLGHARLQDLSAFTPAPPPHRRSITSALRQGHLLTPDARARAHDLRPYSSFSSPRPPSRSAINRASPLSTRSRLSRALHVPPDSLHPHSIGNMARPAASNRPTHIPLPSSPFTERSPYPSPSATPSQPPLASPASPRNSFLPSFMRTRSRAATLSNRQGTTSPTNEVGNPLAGTASRSREASRGPSGGAGTTVTRSISTPAGGAVGLAAIATTNPPDNANTASHTANVSPATATPVQTNPIDPDAKTFRIRLVPHLETSRSLAFDPVVRELLPMNVPAGTAPSAVAATISTASKAINGKAPSLVLKIGRFTDKTAAATAAHSVPGTAIAGGSEGAGTLTGAGRGAAPNAAVQSAAQVTGPLAPLTIAGGGGEVTSGKVAFKSKVVSRAHAEIWCEPGGKFLIRDTASSSGTFLNHIRLSSPNTESRPTVLNDGDLLQLGVDYQGGHEDMFRCVKMRVELGREWQRAANEFNTNALKQLKALGGPTATPDGKGKTVETSPSVKRGKASVTDCCICLFSVTVCQSLFIAPCSHVFHYKCIRPLLMQHHPGFSCPLCRTFANLEEDVETEDAWEIASRRASVISRRPSNHSLRINPTSPTSPTENLAPALASQIALGDSAASVEDLLGGDNGAVAEGNGGLADSITVDRTPTAVQGSTGSARPSMEVDPIDPIREGEEYVMLDNPDATVSVTSPGGTQAVPIAANPHSLSAPSSALDDVQTPMNFTFLAQLAQPPEGAEGMHQRFELANRMEEDGQLPPVPEDEGFADTGGLETVAATYTANPFEVNQDEVMTGEESRLAEQRAERRRSDVDMMYS